jgi:uncharacterized protein (TIGR04255 family)
MHLPEFSHVIYTRNPLIRVACQLRFPPILKISHQDPVDFQDEIRFKYPLFEATRQPFSLEAQQVIQQAIPQVGLPTLSEVCYSFNSEDGKWQILVTKEFITLISLAYERYDLFNRRFREVVEIFERIYKPSFYTRVGLQYQNLIIRSQLGLKDKKWSDLITNQIASELYNPELEPLLQSMQKTLLLKTDICQVTFNQGLVIVKESEPDKSEPAYLLDADFYTEEKVERNENVWNVLSQFNQSAWKLFRWSITETLHNALQPQLIDKTEE